MASSEILPPASIFEKIKNTDERLAEEVFVRAENYANEALQIMPLRQKFRLMVEGAASILGGAPRFIAPPAPSLSAAWQTTGNNIRRAMSEIVEAHHIELTPQEKIALQPI